MGGTMGGTRNKSALASGLVSFQSNDFMRVSHDFIRVSNDFMRVSNDFMR